MAQNKALMAALVAGKFVSCGGVWAATQPAQTGQQLSPQQKTADQDFGKLSADAARGFQDVTMTRLAIFDGRIDAAKKYVADADAAFAKAKTDDSVFTKAESDLKSSSQNKTAASANATPAPSGSNSASTDQAQMNKPQAWLPVDAAMSVDEDFAASPSKTAAIADANTSLHSGDRAGAMEKLKLADTNVAITVAVVPVKQTIDDVHQAVGLINDGKYYEGSQLLRKVVDSERYDVADVAGTPKPATQTSASNSGKAPAKTQ